MPTITLTHAPPLPPPTPAERLGEIFDRRCSALVSDASQGVIDAETLVRLVVGSFVEWALGVTAWGPALTVLCTATWEYRREVRGGAVTLCI